jgi:hypothetical protein
MTKRGMERKVSTFFFASILHPPSSIQSPIIIKSSMYVIIVTFTYCALLLLLLIVEIQELEIDSPTAAAHRI